MVTNRVYKVLVTSGTKGSSVSALTAGQYLVLDKTGNEVTDSTVFQPEDEIQIVTGGADGSKQFSGLIRISDIKAYNKEAYKAKTEQVATVTPPGTITAGHEYNVVVIDKSDKELLQMRQAKRVYSAIADSGETATTLVTKFKDKINADPAAIVTASGTTTLVLTAKSVASTANIVGEFPAQYVFDVFTQDVDVTAFSYYKAGGTVAATTAPDFGSGNFWQVRKLEQRALGYEGQTNRTLFPADSPAYNTSAGTNYDVLVLEFDDKHDTNVVTQGKFEAPRSIVVAVTAGSSSGIDAILANAAKPAASLDTRITALESAS